MVFERNKLLSWIEPVIAAKEQFLEKRPLMNRVDVLGGPERLLGMMWGEQMELYHELVVLRALPRENWNGCRKDVAGEGADVLVHAAALQLTHGWGAMNEGQKIRYIKHLQHVYDIEQEIDIPLPDVAVGVISNKNRFNYREFPFQAIPQESDVKAIKRYSEQVRGLKALRRLHPQGVLTDEILKTVGYEEAVHGVDPVLAYQFLKRFAEWPVTG